jgi:hypothetical protein
LILLRRCLGVARAVFTPLSLLVIVVIIWQSHATLGQTFRQGEWQILMLALLVWMSGHLLTPLVATLEARSCGMHLPYRRALHIHCSRLPAKYLPGGIWHSVGRANDYLALGHGGSKVGLFFLLENCLLVAVTLGMSALIVWPMVEQPLLQTFLRMLSPLMGLSLLAFPLAVTLFRKRDWGLALVPYAQAILALFVYWLLLGFAFICYLSAFDNLQVLGSALQLAAIYIFSWCLGYLALFAPQGIGVAEYISGTLLTDGNAMGAVLAFLVGFRALALVGDLLCWLSIRLFLPKE